MKGGRAGEFRYNLGGKYEKKKNTLYYSHGAASRHEPTGASQQREIIHILYFCFSFFFHMFHVNKHYCY